MIKLLPFLLLALAASGCRVHEYVVVGEEVPLYATPLLDKVVDRMPLGHHEKVSASAKRGVIKVEFHGRTGFARASDLKLLSYVHPELDEGSDREETVGRAVREVTVHAAGKAWTDDVKDAVREGRVTDGMTREQVELAWGWPRTIEPLANPAGAERWIYRRRGYERLDTTMSPAKRFRPSRTMRASQWGLEGSHGVYRLPVIEERVVEFAGDLVSRSYVRRYYDVEGSADEDP